MTLRAPDEKKAPRGDDSPRRVTNPTEDGSRPRVNTPSGFARENPRDPAGSVTHITGLGALHKGLRDGHYSALSQGARALFTLICLESRDWGCMVRQLDWVAKQTGLNRRVLNLKRRELEEAALIRVEYIRRGQRLPTGRRARYEMAVIWPMRPYKKSQEDDKSAPAIKTIMDPAMIDHGSTDHGSTRHTLFCDQILEEEGAEPPPYHTDDLAKPPSNPFASIATDLLQRWKERLAPAFGLYDDPETYLESHAMVVQRLAEGFSKAQCLAAIEAHVYSPHNQGWERRTIQQVFGDPERLQRMSALGMSMIGMDPEAKTGSRSKPLTLPVETRELQTREELVRRIAQRKFEVQEIWKNATALARKGVGLGVSRGYPAQDLENAALQVPLDIVTWADFEKWLTSAIVEWHATGQQHTKFDATTSAFYRWLANNRKHPHARGSDMNQGGSGTESWLDGKEF